MPLPVFDTQDAVPDDQREDYVEHEGKWHPKVVVDLATETKKRAQLLSEKKEADRLRKEAERERDELKQVAEARSQGVTDEQLKKIEAAVEAKIKPKDDKIAELESRLRKITFEDKGKALLLAAGVMPDRIKSAWKDAKDYLDLTEEGDGFIVKDENGNLTGEKVEDFVKKTFKASHSFYYAGSQASGSGAGGSNGAGNDSQNRPAVKPSQLEQKRAQVAGAL